MLKKLHNTLLRLVEASQPMKIMLPSNDSNLTDFVDGKGMTRTLIRCHLGRTVLDGWP